MAEPLKNSFGPEVPERIADVVSRAHVGFDRESFLAVALEGYEDLELTARARQISDALAECLPADREKAIGILVAALGSEHGAPELTGFESFLYLPMVFFVADYGLDCYETSMRAQYELTKRFTAEFSIRAFLDRYPEETLSRLSQWASDPDPHVRRLVSEGTRPRLPWASRLTRFQEDPSPVLVLLEMLKDDPEEYVRRSVANNLNDISKDHPDVAVAVARRWWSGATPERQRLVRHGLRTLVKAANADALAVLGYGSESPVTVGAVTCTPARAEIGGKIRIEIEVENRSDGGGGALIDLRVHFVKANGATRPKVFKGAEVTLDAGSGTRVRKTISLAQHSTRTHYPGRHEVEVVLNGVTHPGCGFDLL